jgi:hypothetical protein
MKWQSDTLYRRSALTAVAIGADRQYQESGILIPRSKRPVVYRFPANADSQSAICPIYVGVLPQLYTRFRRSSVENTSAFP